MRNLLLVLLCSLLSGCVGWITYSPSFNDCQYVSYERHEERVVILADCDLGAAK